MTSRCTDRRGRSHSVRKRLNELLYFEAGAGRERSGFRRIEAGPAHPPYDRFCVAPGHQIGFNDLKAIEIAGFAAAIAGVAAGNPSVSGRA